MHQTGGPWHSTDRRGLGLPKPPFSGASNLERGWVWFRYPASANQNSPRRQAAHHGCRLLSNPLQPGLFAGRIVNLNSAETNSLPSAAGQLVHQRRSTRRVCHRQPFVSLLFNEERGDGEGKLSGRRTLGLGSRVGSSLGRSKLFTLNCRQASLHVSHHPNGMSSSVPSAPLTPSSVMWTWARQADGDDGSELPWAHSRRCWEASARAVIAMTSVVKHTSRPSSSVQLGST